MDFDVGVTEQYTDNSNLSAANPERDLISTPRFGLAYSRKTAKTDANVAFQIHRDIYKNQTQDDQTFPSLNALVNWSIVRERFTWLLQDIASQNEIDVRGAPTTDNTQNVNVFLTGPEGFFRFGPSANMSVGARFGKSNFEITDEDSTRAVGFMRFFYEKSAFTSLSVNYDLSEVNFKDAANSDFDRQDLFLQISARRSRADVLFDLGATRIDRRDIEDKEIHPLFRFSWTRKLTRKSIFGLRLAREESDSGLNLLTVGTAPPNLAPGGSVANTPEVFTDRRLNLFYTNVGRRTRATVSLFARDQDYQIDDSDDQRTVGTGLAIVRDLTRRLGISFRVAYGRNEFTALVPSRTDWDSDISFDFIYRLGHRLVFNGGLRWRGRESTDPVRDYTETRAILGITYARTGTTEKRGSLF